MTIQALEPHLLEGLRHSAKEILETMVFITPKAIDAVPEDSSAFQAPVIGLLGFTGTRSGTFVVRTDETIARTVAAKMLMMEVGELGSFQDASDAFGEVVNMLAGNFKNAWVATGNQMELSVPNVIHNGQVKLRSDEVGCLRTCIRVQLDIGTIDVGVHFEQQH